MLEIKNLSSGYGKKTVLYDASLKVKKGEVVSVIGPNGSGKSTLLKSIAGILSPFSGEIIIDGDESSKMPRQKKAQCIAYLAQGRDVPDMTAGQLVLHGRFPYLGFPRVYSERDREIAITAMRTLGIDSLYNQPLKTLSGGTRQEVYIAGCLAQDTDYILLDEPTTYLDISHQLELMKIIKSLADLGKGIVTVMHDLTLAFNFSDRIAVMNDGRIVAESTPDGLCDSGSIDELFKVSVIKAPNSDTYCIDYLKET